MMACPSGLSRMNLILPSSFFLSTSISSSQRACPRSGATVGKPAAFTLVARSKARGDSIRTDRWRFTRWSDGAIELYDHAADAEEEHNVASAHPETIRDLSTQLSVALATAAGPTRSAPAR